MVKGAYVHIPFCEHICYYCDFNKYFIKNQPVNAYLRAMETEIANAVKDQVEPLETIFVGGGTPTALNLDQMDMFLKILGTQLLRKGHTIEYTMEANPENLDEAKLNLMRAAGVNRLSIGVQTFDDQLLESIGRGHDREGAFRGVKAARKAGFDNISVDLMFGLPGQTEVMLDASIKDALSLDPEHISVYSLQIEPRTIFYNRMKKGKLTLPGQDIEADMYEKLISTLAAHGYAQYEISNFAKPGKESVHNLLYWDNEEYYGFGAGAHGYIGSERVVNARAVKGYIRRVGEDGHAQTASHPVTRQEKIEEEMFLGLRKLSGVNKNKFNEKYQQSVDVLYRSTIDDLKAKGLLYEDQDQLSLTKKGVFLGNEVFQAFLA